jgi:hypothetical protein
VGGGAWVDDHDDNVVRLTRLEPEEVGIVTVPGSPAQVRGQFSATAEAPATGYDQSWTLQVVYPHNNLRHFTVDMTAIPAGGMVASAVCASG